MFSMLLRLTSVLVVLAGSAFASDFEYFSKGVRLLERE